MIERLAIPALALLVSCGPSTQAPVAREAPVHAIKPVAAAPVAAPAPPRRVAGGMFGRNAVSIWERLFVRGANGRTLLVSPNGHSRLRARQILATGEVEEDRLLIDLSGAVGRHDIPLIAGVGAEAIWNPGADAVLLSASGGGLNGMYDLLLIDRRGVRNLAPAIRRRFGHPVRCDYPEPPNVAGIDWLPNGNLLAAAETVHHSICDSFGTFKAYEVDPARMRIVREYDQIEAKRRFRALLGWELVDAPDRCVRRPADCRVADGYNGE